MTESPTADAHAERLRELGADPAPFLEYGPAAAERAGGAAQAAECLDALARFAEAVHAAGESLYFPFCYDVKGIGEVLAGQPEAFLRALEDLAAVISVGERATRAIQQGVPAVARAARAVQANAEPRGYGPPPRPRPARPWVVSDALSFAARLTGSGLRCGDTLAQSVPTLVEALGSPEARGRDEAQERAVFGAGLAALERFVARIDGSGVVPTYPIQQGLIGAIEAWGLELEALPDALDDLGDLVAGLVDAGISPYPVLEHGLAHTLAQTRSLPWLRDEVFPFAALMARVGLDPTLALEGLRNLASVDEPVGRPILRWAEALAADGIDPGWNLAFALFVYLRAVQSPDDLERVLGLADGLTRAVHAGGHQPMLTFRYGLPELSGADLDLERVLAQATELARRGIDPGPPLKNGYACLGSWSNERPEVAGPGLDLAEALVASGHSPWRALQSGLPAAIRAAGDDVDASVELLARLGELLADLHQRGIETDDLLLFGIDSLGKGARGDRALFETQLGLLRELVADLAAAGFSPIHTVGTGLPAVSKAFDGDPAQLEAAVELARELARAGVDPAPLLTHAVPTLIGAPAELLTRTLELCQAARAADLPTAPLGQAIAALREADAPARLDALDAALRLVEAGVDPAPLLHHATPDLLAVASPEARPPALDLLFASARTRAERGLSSEGFDDAACAQAIRVSAGDDVRLGEALQATLGAAARVAGSSAPVPAFLRAAPAAAAEVAGDRPQVFADLLAELADWTVEHAAAPGLGHVLGWTLRGVATTAGGDPQAVRDALPVLAALAGLAEVEELFRRGLGAARAGAGDDAAGLRRALGDLHRIGAGGADPNVLYRIERLTALVRRLPQAWSALIVPTCLGLGAGAPTVLDALRYLERYLRAEDDLQVVKELITQHGVRAPDLLGGLLLDGLRGGQIGSLADERALLLEFVAEVPFPDPDYYAEYRRIMTDEALAPAARRERVTQLHAELEAITAAVVAGAVSEEQERHALFAQVLTYVFPPARSAGRRSYLSLYRRFPDRPQDVTALAARGPLPEPEVRLATGGYRIRAGSEVDPAAWEGLRDVVAAVTDPGEPEGLADLGQALFEAWIRGDLGKPRTKDALLTRLYRLHRAVHPGLPDALDDAGAFLKYREFLSDTARELTQEALAAFRAAQPERYERQARAKLDPRRRPGKGLLRGVWRTIAAVQAGELERGAALERLGRQLKGYDLAGVPAQDALLGASEATLPGVIDGLPAEAVDVRLGEEHTRVLADLVGHELAAMQRELFGADGAPGKLEYSRESGGPELVLRLEPTKRKAHAPVGLCEGVCTATDLQLWETEAFLQCVIWGPDQRARGGLHLLRVERTRGDGVEERALALPGINPSLELLREVGAEAILDAALSFAHALAAAWNLDAVWIPTHRGITSNRGPVRQALEQRDYPTAQVASVPFSYSPYAYTFDEVWVVTPPAAGGAS